MFINICFWKYENNKKDYSSMVCHLSIDTFEELENDLIIYLENETNVYKLELNDDIQVIELWLREDKRLIEYYICLDDTSEEEKRKIKKLVLDYYREVML